MSNLLQYAYAYTTNVLKNKLFLNYITVVLSGGVTMMFWQLWNYIKIYLGSKMTSSVRIPLSNEASIWILDYINNNKLFQKSNHLTAKFNVSDDFPSRKKGVLLQQMKSPENIRYSITETQPIYYTFNSSIEQKKYILCIEVSGLDNRSNSHENSNHFITIKKWGFSTAIIQEFIIECKKKYVIDSSNKLTLQTYDVSQDGGIWWKPETFLNNKPKEAVILPPTLLENIMYRV